MRYFALLDTGRVTLIPGATTFEEADAAPIGNVTWIFNEEDLRTMVASANTELADQSSGAVADAQPTKALANALQAMWGFASALVEKHGMDGDDTMTDDEHAAWQEAAATANHLLSAADVARQADHFSGFLTLGGERVQIDFSAPANATKAERDSAFLLALSEQGTVELDYLAIGSS